MNFRRITSSGHFIPQVDGCRFVAIAIVVLYHLDGYRHGFHSGLVRPFDLGFRGVHLFFVLSGFILGLPFARHHLCGDPVVDLKKYFLRRVTRLEPPYVVSTLILFALVQVIHLSAAHGDVGLAHLFATLTYTHNIVYGTMSTINGVAWSLEVEIQFYCLMPLLAMLYRLPLRRLAIACGIAGFAALSYLSPDSPRLYMSLLGNLQFFGAGMLLADLYATGMPKSSRWWDAVSLLWILVLLLPGRPFMVALPFLCVALYTAFFSGPLTSRIMSWSWITTIGGMCYSIYLLHDPIVWFAAKRISNPYLGAALGLTAVLVSSIAFFLLIERPTMRPDWPARLVAWMRTARDEKNTQGSAG